jgi:hypothetical protein
MNPLSGVLSEAWTLYKRHARHLLVIALVVYVVAGILEAVLAGFLGIVGALLAAIVSLIAAFLLQAALVKAVDDVRDGRADLSLSDTLNAAKPHVGRVAGASIIAGFAIGIGLILLIAPGLYLLTIWCLIVPVIVLEGAGIGAAFTRSRELVRGNGWNVLGVIVLVFLLLLGVEIVLGLILTALPDGVQSLISGIVSGTLTAPYLALVLTLSYFRLRQVHGGDGSVAPPPAPTQYGG